MKKSLLLTVLMVLWAAASYAFIGGGNLVINGGFEEDNFNAYSKAESCVINTTDAHSGTNSCEQTGGTKYIAQSIPVVGGLSYKVSFWYKVKTVNDDTDVRIWSSFNNGTMSSEDIAKLQGPDGGYLPNVSEWTKYEVVVEAPVEATAFNYEFRTYSGAVVLWDDLSVVEQDIAPADAKPKVMDVLPLSGTEFNEGEQFEVSAVVTTSDPAGIDTVVLATGSAIDALNDTVAMPGADGNYATPVVIDSAGTYYGQVIAVGVNGKVSVADPIQVVVKEESNDTTTATGGGLIIAGVVDADLAGGVPKLIELYALSDIADLSEYGVGIQSNANTDVPSVGYTLTGSVSKGDFIYITKDLTSFEAFFGSSISNVQLYSGLGINGDDRVFLFKDSSPIDIYGVNGADGSGSDWEYTDGWAYSLNSRTVSTDFAVADWTVSKKGLDGFATNDEAGDNKFPLGTYSYQASAGGDTAAVIDTIAPVWANGYPKSGGETDSSFQILAKLNEPAIIYGMALLSALETEPTAAEIVAAARAQTGGDSLLLLTAEEYSFAFEASVGDTIYIYAVAADTLANLNEEVQFFTGMPKYELTTIASETFDADLGVFSSVSQSGTVAWVQDSYNDDAYAKINTFGNGVNESWLVSPAVDLTAITNEVFRFDVASYNANKTIADCGAEQFEVYYTVSPQSGTIVPSEWTRFTSVDDVMLGAKFAFTSVELDLSSLGVDSIYVAFRHKSGESNGTTWEVDNCEIAGLIDNTKDASLSSLMVNGMEIEGFDPAVKEYIYHLPVNEANIPTVTVAAKVKGAPVSMVEATNLNGEVADRTTTVTVTALDGETKTSYSILFNTALVLNSVAEVKAGEMNRVYGLGSTALVTITNSYKNRRFIQDATGAIMIYDAAGVITTPIAAGDSIQGIVGKLGKISGMTVFIPDSAMITVVNSGNAVVAENATVAQIKANLADYMHKYVKVADVEFVNPQGAFGNGKNYDLASGSDTLVVRTDFFGALSSDIPTSKGSLSALVMAYYSTIQLVPTSEEDLDFQTQALEGTNALKLNVYPNPTASAIYMSKAVEAVEVYNLAGKSMVRAMSVEANSAVDVSALNAGIYMVKVTVDGQSAITKLIKK